MSRLLPTEIDLAEKYGVKLEVNTNGTLLNVKKALFAKIVKNASSIAFLFDSPVKETYESIRIGADFSETVENMRLFQEFRNSMPLSERPYFFIKMVLMRRNLNQVIKMVEFAKNMGVDSVHISHVLIFREEMQQEALEDSKENVNNTLLMAEQFARDLQMSLVIPPLFNLEASETKKQIAEIKQKEESFKRCSFLWGRVYIDGNANIFPCCEPSHPVVGSIKDKDFEEIWNGELYQAMRKTFTGGPYYKLCYDCVKTGYLSKTNP